MLTEAVKNLFEQCEPVGSRVVVDPAPADSDEDWLCLVNDQTVYAALEATGFAREGGPKYEGSEATSLFVSWRREEVNLLTTEDRAFFDRFMAGTRLAVRLKVVDKQDRVALFQAVLYGK